MNKLSLLIDKILVSIIVLMLFIDSLEGVSIPGLAYNICLIIIGTLRGLIVLTVLIMNITKYGYKKLGKIYYKRDRKGQDDSHS